MPEQFQRNERVRQRVLAENQRGQTDEFAVASRMVQRPGRLYALDLAGSCLAAILFSVWLVPVFGFFRTALLSAMVSLAPAALAMFADAGTVPAE